jgi:hypothetical protein
MAQETAGTIGIPVLKNEVLPYLTDYSKRKERAEFYKQKAEQRAAELAAKKESELEKYIPPAFETAKGGYWQPAIKQRMEGELKNTLQRISSAKTPAEKSKASEDYSAIMKELNYGGELETQKQKENLKALQDSGYVADENALSQYYRDQAATNPKFFETNHITGFQKWLQNNPEKYINPAAIGTSLLKQFKPQNIEVTNRNRETEKFEYNPLFTPERKYDNVAKAEVISADKVNPDAAFKALQSNKTLLGAAEKYIQNEAQKIKTPGMSDTEAYTLATDRFFGEALQQGRGGQKYDYSLQFKGARSGGGGKPPIEISSKSPGVRSIEFKVTPYNPKDARKVQQASVGTPDDVEHTYSKPYAFNANVPVFLMQNPDDLGTIDKYFGQKPDGSYTLKAGFEYQSPIESTVYFADKDIRFYGPTGKVEDSYVVKKGTPLDNETALSLIRQKKTDLVKKRNGYEVTGTMNVPLENEKTGDVKEVRRPVVRMFIPKENAASIDKHILMEKRKVNAFEASSPKEAGEFQYFSNP